MCLICWSFCWDAVVRTARFVHPLAVRLCVRGALTHVSLHRLYACSLFVSLLLNGSHYVGSHGNLVNLYVGTLFRVRS